MVEVKLLGNRVIYGRLFKQGEERTLQRFKEILGDLGIKEVYCKEEVGVGEILDKYKTPCLLVLPQFPNHNYGVGLRFSTSVKQGYNFILYNGIHINNSQEINYNGLFLGCKLGNVVILYFNPFPLNSRIRYFESVINVITESLHIEKIIKPPTQEELMNINVNKFLQNVCKKIIENTREINGIERNLNDYQQSILTNLKKMDYLQIENDALERIKPTLKENFVKRFEEAKELKVIKEIKLTEDGIVVEFGDIYIKDKEKTYFIGNFTGFITPIGITFKNNSFKSKCHPHISNGNPCFGTFTIEINNMLAKMELKKLIFSLAQYLRTYSLGHYVCIEQWKEVNKNESVSNK